MPAALPHDEKFRVAHYLARAEQRGECLCIGKAGRYPSWHKMPGRTSEKLATLVCRVVHGPRPSGAVVLHSCDNRACIKPEHLSWGTTSQNLKDATARGRMKQPVVDQRARLVAGKHQWGKLLPEDVGEIRDRLRAGERQEDIAKDFPIGHRAVSKIKLGQRWGWL